MKEFQPCFFKNISDGCFCITNIWAINWSSADWLEGNIARPSCSSSERGLAAPRRSIHENSSDGFNSKTRKRFRMAKRKRNSLTEFFFHIVISSNVIPICFFLIRMKWKKQHKKGYHLILDHSFLFELMEQSLSLQKENLDIVLKSLFPFPKFCKNNLLFFQKKKKKKKNTLQLAELVLLLIAIIAASLHKLARSAPTYPTVSSAIFSRERQLSPLSKGYPFVWIFKIESLWAWDGTGIVISFSKRPFIIF